uniref:Uncharacterized protein n=1 Tax=Angiostrongylus cantonensis TaxID=6313 RepID=A0A0K0DMF8_ANGCA
MIVKFGIDPRRFNREHPVLVVGCSNESMFMGKLELTRTPTPPTTPLLSHVPKNTSSLVSLTEINVWRSLVSSKAMASYFILPACMSKSSVEDSDGSVRTL